MSKLLNIFLIFSILISFSFAFDTKNIAYQDFINKEIKEISIEKGISYIISYEIGDITKNYIKIFIKSDDISKYLYVYYSPITQNREDAYLLNQGKNEIYLYINKAFTKSEASGFIYLTIECFDSDCPFTLSSSEADYIDLGRNSQYSYFTTNKKNLVNTFMVYAKEKTDEEDYITFWAAGNKNVQMNIKYVNDNSETQLNSSSFYNGQISLIKEIENNLVNDINEKSHYIIEVTSPANSLITFGNNVRFNKPNQIEPTKYSINSNEIYSVLTKDSNIQCFDFSIVSDKSSYLSIVDFNNNLKLEINKKEGENIEEKIIENGNILFEIKSEYKDYYFCLSKKFNEIEEDSVFLLQVTDDVENNYYKNIYSPQINGIFYERYLEKNQLAFFTGLPSLDFKTELRYYLKKNSGYPEMYFVKCTTYPNCKFDINSLPSDKIKPKEVNDMFSYSIFKTESMKLISPEQYVLLVHCNGDLPCSFQTNFYSELDQILLQKGKRTYHTIMSKGENNFLIYLDGESQYKQIFVNFLTYSGDISIKAEAQDFKIRDYIAGNKKYFVLDFQTDDDKVKTTKNKIYFKITGELPSFYSADYKLIYSDADKIRMYEESGINYLETIEPKIGNKTISLTNRRLFEKRNFSVNFFSLNCEIDITRKISDNTKKLETFDFLAQDVILTSDTIYNNEYYDYLMEIKKMDNVTEFDQNWCMVYISSIEQNLNDEKDYQKRHLLVSESVINRVILNQQMPKIEYIYPHMNPKGYVIMNLNWQTNSKLMITIYIENKEYKKIVTSQSQYIIITESELRSDDYCPYLSTKPNQVCSIVVLIELAQDFYNEEPIFEFNIKSQEIVPAFVRKSMLRKDVIVGNYFQYFFTEVGIQEEGNINIKFDRGSGKVYGRIVEKNKNEGSGWMNRIILPDENNNDLPYNYFTKKMFYGGAQTSICEEGCYLIIKVVPNFSDDNFKSENIAYPISLSLNANDGRYYPTQDKITIVDIPLNEFIVGDTVPYSGMFGVFYSLFIPYDCEELIIEFLCESSYIYINVGNKKPLLKEADFSYKVMDTDGILKITKKQILDKLAKSNIDSIKNVQLTIAIGAKFFDDEASSVYSFRIRALRENELELITLTSDQETLCNFVGPNGNCYFIIPYDRKIDEQNNIFFHAVFLPNVEFNYYANEVSKETITNRNKEAIEKIIPKKDSCKWSNAESRGNYLYIDYKDISDKENSYIMLNLEVNAPYQEENDTTTVTLLHTLYSYKGSILPNPASAQLFLINNHNSNELKFEFKVNTQNLLIRLKSVSGTGIVYWDKTDENNVKIQGNNLKLNSDDENVYYYFNVPGETITLTLGFTDRIPLHFKNANPNTGKDDSNISPGFGFYSFYERETTSDNYNYVDYGENSLYNFKDVDFPFVFYTMIPDKEHEIDVNIQLLSLKKKFSGSSNNNILTNEETENEIPSFNDFYISGLILDEETIYKRHVRPDIQPDKNLMFNGEYDPVTNLFKIQFTPEIIKNYNVEGHNYIYLKINKNNTNTIQYSESSMIIDILPSNDDGVIVEKNKYIYGKIPFKQDGYSRYELSRINSNYKFMRIEFSANYENINFALNSYKLGDDISKIDFYKNNIEFKNESYYGKTIVTIEFQNKDIKSIYLSVFNIDNNHNNNESKLSNFIFKYEIKETNDFIKIKPKEESLVSKYDRSTLTLNLPLFESIPTGAKANYIAKLIPKENILKNENLMSLSLIESKIIKLYKKTQTDFSKNDTMTLLDIHNDKDYTVLISCKIETNNYNELFSFKYINIDKKIEEEEKDHTLLIVLLSVFGSIIIIAIIFIVICLVLRRGILKKRSQLDNLTKQLNEEGQLADFD